MSTFVTKVLPGLQNFEMYCQGQSEASQTVRSIMDNLNDDCVMPEIERHMSNTVEKIAEMVDAGEANTAEHSKLEGRINGFQVCVLAIVSAIEDESDAEVSVISKSTVIQPEAALAH